MAEIARPAPGVSAYRNDGPGGNDAFSLVIHFTADPAKRELCYRRGCGHLHDNHKQGERYCQVRGCKCLGFVTWARKESRRYLGGEDSIDFRQEYHIDFESESGILTFYAWSSEYNLVAPFRVPAE